MAAALTFPRLQILDSTGAPMVGAKIYTYQNKTTTPSTTWQNKEQTTPNLNPIVLDARGEAVVYLDPAQVYTFVLRDWYGTLVWTQDDISGAASQLDIQAVVERLADTDDPDNGAEMIGFGDTTAADALQNAPYAVNNINALVSFASRAAMMTAGRVVSLREYRPGSGVGGGDFVWDPEADKAQHDGGAIIDPSKTTPSDWDNDAQRQAWYENDGVGTGCFVRTVGNSVSPVMYGVFGDAVKNDVWALWAMLRQHAGKRTIDMQGGRFYVGFADAHEAAKFRFRRVNGIRIVGSGTFYADNRFSTQDIRYESIFEFVDCSDLRVDVRVIGDAIDLNEPQNSGVVAVSLVSDTVDAHDIEINAYLENGVAPLHTRNSWGLRRRTSGDPVMRGLKFNIIANMAKYGTRMMGCGNNVTGTITTQYVTRSYFPMGVENHNITINSERQRFITDLLIKAYNDPTRNIHVVFNQSIPTSTEETFTIEHENDTDDTVIENVAIDINGVRAATARPIGLIGVSYTAAGVRRVQTNCITNNINVRMNGYGSFENARMLAFPTVALNPSIITLDRAVNLFLNGGFPGTGGYTLASGDALRAVTIGAACRIKLGELIAGNCAALLTVICYDDWDAPVDGQHTHMQISFHKQSAGGGTINGTDIISEITKGTGRGFSLAIVGDWLEISAASYPATSIIAAEMRILGTRFA